MASEERSRFPDIRASSTSESIPEPSPLPLARSVLDRFRYGRKQTPSASQPSSPKDVYSFRNERFGPVTPQTTSHRTGSKLRALDINQNRTHVVLAGGKILKTIRVDDTPNCSEDFNLRTTALNYALDRPQNSVGTGSQQQYGYQDVLSAQRDLFDIEDVAWSNNQFRDYIATAVRNGKIVLYDLRKAGVQVGSMEEHFRQVHKVDFNPKEGACLLSGSQDGTVRLWDLRYRVNSALSTSMNTFRGRSEGVRHVKWSPRDTWLFAIATDNGTIQRWDTRNARAPVLTISAHYGTCNSIDWHPDGKHLVSAGKDQVVKVWNVSHSGTGRKTVFSFRAPREVQNVRWRPSCFVTDSSDQGVKQCTHLATSYKSYPVVHVWDLRRPLVPFREVHYSINEGTTDMLWRNKDLLWTVGPEGEFMQTDVPFAPKTIDRRPLSVASCAPDGDLFFFSKKRFSQRVPRNQSNIGADRSFQRKEDTEKAEHLPLRRSPGDDSLDEKFLNAPARKRHYRTPSIKSTRLLSTTPPSVEELSRMATIDLDHVMEMYDSFRPLQFARMGTLPGTSQSAIFSFLATKYELPSALGALSPRTVRHIQSGFDHNSECARKASLYRAAQTWKILGSLVGKEINRRARYNSQMRLDRASTTGGEAVSPADVSKHAVTDGIDQAKHEVENTRDRRAQGKPKQETSSNVATPVIKAKGENSKAPVLSSTLAAEFSKTSSIPVPINSDRKTALDDSSDQVASSPDTKTSPHPVHGLAPYQRTNPGLHSVAQKSSNIDIPQKLTRHNSSDSLLIFSTSSDFLPERPDIGSYNNNKPFHTRRRSSALEDIFKLGQKLSTTDSTSSSIEMHNLPSQNSSGKDKSLPDGNFKELSERAENPNIHNLHGTPVNWPKRKQIIPNTKMSTKMVQDPIESRDHQSESEDLIEADFLKPTPNMHEGPIAITEIFMRLFTWSMRNYDSQMASHIVALAIYPIASLDESFQSNEDDDISAYSSTFEQLTSSPFSYSAGEAERFIRKAYIPLERMNINPLMVEAVLEDYHTKLLRARLNVPAASLRKLCHPWFPSVSETFIQDFSVAFSCSKCKTKITGPARTKCPACGADLRCAVCLSKFCPYPWPPEKKHAATSSRSSPPPPSPTSAVGARSNFWHVCGRCGHMVHAGCFETYREWILEEQRAWDEERRKKDLLGFCPGHPKCPCDCVGLKKGAVGNASGTGGTVRGDEIGVGESRAVGAVRERLGGGKWKAVVGLGRRGEE